MMISATRSASPGRSPDRLRSGRTRDGSVDRKGTSWRPGRRRRGTRSRTRPRRARNRPRRTDGSGGSFCRYASRISANSRSTRSSVRDVHRVRVLLPASFRIRAITRRTSSVVILGLPVGVSRDAAGRERRDGTIRDPCRTRSAARSISGRSRAPRVRARFGPEAHSLLPTSMEERRELNLSSRIGPGTDRVRGPGAKGTGARPIGSVPFRPAPTHRQSDDQMTNAQAGTAYYRAMNANAPDPGNSPPSPTPPNASTGGCRRDRPARNPPRRPCRREDRLLPGTKHRRRLSPPHRPIPRAAGLVETWSGTTGRPGFT